MLSQTPSTFNHKEVTFKELDELSSLEKVLFNEFIVSSYSHMDSQRLSWAPYNADQIFHSLNTTFKEDIRWVIYSKGRLAGFWFITEKDNNELGIEFYVSHGFEGGALDCFLSTFFSHLSQQVKSNLFLNLNNFSDRRLNCFLDEETLKVADLKHVNCRDLKSEIKDPNFEILIEQVKAYYL
jgi:hypothetical protein